MSLVYMDLFMGGKDHGGMEGGVDIQAVLQPTFIMVMWGCRANELQA